MNYGKILNIITNLAIILLIIVAIHMVLIKPMEIKKLKRVTVSSPSMEPTLMTDNSYLVDVNAYKNGTIKRNDIIIFKSDFGHGEAVYGKRVVAVPKDVVEIKDGAVYVNGQKYCEDIKYDGTFLHENSTMTIPEENYYIIGDNNAISYDSRDVGCIDGKSIIGKVKFCIEDKTNNNRIGAVK